MHRLEFGIFALATIIDAKLDDPALARVAFALASHSHYSYAPIGFESNEDDPDDVIEHLRTMSAPYMYPKPIGKEK